MQVEWEERFSREVQQYIDYGIDNFGERVAFKHLKRLEKKLTDLEHFPELGFPEPLLSRRKKQYRTLLFEKRYKVIYHVDYDNEIIVIDDFWDLRKRQSTLIKRIK